MEQKEESRKRKILYFPKKKKETLGEKKELIKGEMGKVICIKRKDVCKSGLDVCVSFAQNRNKKNRKNVRGEPAECTMNAAPFPFSFSRNATVYKGLRGLDYQGELKGVSKLSAWVVDFLICGLVVLGARELFPVLREEAGGFLFLGVSVCYFVAGGICEGWDTVGRGMWRLG